MSMCPVSPHPGEFIKEVYLDLLDVSYRTIAKKLNRLIQCKSNVSPEMALRLSKTLGRSAQSWLIMQDNYNLYQVKQNVNLDEVEKLIIAF